MKVGEVHIKDWVNLSDEMGNIAPFRVNSVQCGDVVAENYITVSDFFNPFYEGEFQPIPITTDILKKNGFTVRIFPLDTICIWECDKSRIMWSGSMIDVRQWDSCKAYQGSAKYIHELQQAIRLCEIDKRIEL